uniref:Uncharacterized protein n=1 Tax=Oryza nivara TaxID=4536 RepID=A0A0E0GK16_ORYNI
MSLAATANIVSASPLHVRQHNDGNDYLHICNQKALTTRVAQALHGLVTQGEMGVVFDESDEEV